MPASTPIYSLPYPLLGDSADIEQAVKPLAIALDNKLASAGGAALYVTTVGDTVSRVINVNHQLGTPNVSPVLRLASTGEVVQAEAYVLDNDNLRLVFASPPGNAAVVVAIFGGVTPPPAPIGVYSANIGDGASSGPFLVNHLLGTRDFVLQAFLNVAPYDEVELDYERTDGNTVTVYTRGIVPATNGVRVMVLSRAGLQGAAAQHGVNHIPGGNDYVPIPTVTSLPSAPVDGQECYYVADATNGIVWHLKYRAGSASPYKWEYIGGPAVAASVNTNEPRNNVAFGDLATVGPSLVTPLAGDYDIPWGAKINTPVTTNGLGLAGLQIGATPPADAESLIVNQGSTIALSADVYRDHPRRLAIPAGTTVKMVYRDNGGGAQALFQQRRISVRPVRVG